MTLVSWTVSHWLRTEAYNQKLNLLCCFKVWAWEIFCVGDKIITQLSKSVHVRPESPPFFGG